MKAFILTVLLSGSTPLLMMAPPRVLFGPHDTLLTHAQKLLASGQHSIVLATYLLTNATLVRALIAAHTRGVKVQVICDHEMTKRTRGRQVLFQLRRAHIPSFIFSSPRAAALMHHKFAVVDNTVWYGSANWTTMGMTGNNENVVVHNDAATAQRLRTHFTTLKKRLFRQRVTTTRSPSDTLFFIPDHARYVKKRLLADIAQAKQRIWVASFELTHRSLLGALRAAQQRGISVRLLTDKQNRVPSGARGTAPPHGCMHHKYALIDDVIWTGSMNWTTRGLTTHQELVSRLSDAQLLSRYLHDFERLWSQKLLPDAQ